VTGAASGQSSDLTGLWLDNTGGGTLYRLRQVGTKLYWSVDAGPGRSINVYVGEISGSTINGIWVDVPQSSTNMTGVLNLRIDSNDRLVKIAENPCCYGAQSWTRQGSTPPPNAGTGTGTGGSTGTTGTSTGSNIGGSSGSAGTGAGTSTGGAGTPGASGGTSSGSTLAPATNIDWNRRGLEWRGKHGQHVPLSCPPNGVVREIWGTDTYTDDSAICVAAVHAGVITLQNGGRVVIEIMPGQDSYTGSARNRFSSSNFGTWPGSYRFPAP
jgi:hypothetical protein